jgi:hypothetical protein
MNNNIKDRGWGSPERAKKHIIFGKAKLSQYAANGCLVACFSIPITKIKTTVKRV